MAEYLVEYSKHATLEPGIVDRVRLNVEANPTVLGVVVANRSADHPLFFDVDYGDGREARFDITPFEDDTFIVTPNYAMTMEFPFVIRTITLVSQGVCPYSVMIIS